MPKSNKKTTHVDPPVRLLDPNTLEGLVFSMKAKRLLECAPKGWPESVPDPMRPVSDPDCPGGRPPWMIWWHIWEGLTVHQVARLAVGGEDADHDQEMQVEEVFTHLLLEAADAHFLRYGRLFCQFTPAERVEVILDVYEVLGYDVVEAGWR